MSQLLHCTVNGVEVERMVDDERTLLAFLREDLGLTGTKVGCGEGDCGACTVLVDGVWRCWQKAAASSPLKGLKKTDG